MTTILELHNQVVESCERQGISLPTEEQLRALMLSAPQDLLDKVIDYLLAWGPITKLLLDTAITEIMVNGPESIYIERQGVIEKTDLYFENNDMLLALIDRIAARVGRRIDVASPFVDARLPDGSRVNAIIAPLSLSGPILTIRRFPAVPPRLGLLVQRGTLPLAMSQFLRECVAHKINMVISGGTGSGKTTLLNALAMEIEASERIISIEDAAELRIAHPHVLSLEARAANMEGIGEVTVRQLLKNALRMRPDRIIVGEIRSGEALDMLQAMNTGHQGSLTTVHANSALEALFRIETMVLMADVALPLFAIRQQIEQALQIIVQLERLPEGERKVVSVQAVSPGRGENYKLVPLYQYEKQKDTFVWLGEIEEIKTLFAKNSLAPNSLWEIS